MPRVANLNRSVQARDEDAEIEKTGATALETLQANPANSSVSVSMPVKSMFTGWEARKGHFMYVGGFL